MKLIYGIKTIEEEIPIYVTKPPFDWAGLILEIVLVILFAFAFAVSYALMISPFII